MKLLLQQGYHASTADYDKRTALMLAAGNGHKVGLWVGCTSNLCSRLCVDVQACVADCCVLSAELEADSGLSLHLITGALLAVHLLTLCLPFSSCRPPINTCLDRLSWTCCCR